MPDRNGSALSDRGRWGIVVLLTAVHILAYVDRMLPLLLIEKIKLSLDLTDFQIGILIGPAFATFYIVFAIPLGWLVDRWNRTRLLAIAVLFWSIMTAVAGVASTLTILIISRVGVGLAEACLSPCALSLIADHVTPANRTRAVAIFQAGATTGSFVAMAGGGALLRVLEQNDRLHVPFVGVAEPWQEMFLISALLGLPLTLILILLRDRRHPVRAGLKPAGAPDRAGGLGDYLRGNWLVFSGLLMAGIGYTALGNIASWSVAVFSRVWQWDAAEAGPVTGTIALIGALSGAAIAVWISDRVKGERPSPRPADAIVVGLVLSTASFASYAHAPSVTMTAILYGLGVLGMSCAVTGAMTVLTLAVPQAIRGKVSAIYFFCVTLVGVGVLQPLVGSLSDRYGLPMAITGTALLFGLASVAAAMLARIRIHRVIDGQVGNPAPALPRSVLPVVESRSQGVSE